MSRTTTHHFETGPTGPAPKPGTEQQDRMRTGRGLWWLRAHNGDGEIWQAGAKCGRFAVGAQISVSLGGREAPLRLGSPRVATKLVKCGQTYVRIRTEVSSSDMGAIHDCNCEVDCHMAGHEIRETRMWQCEAVMAHI